MRRRTVPRHGRRQVNSCPVIFVGERGQCMQWSDWFSVGGLKLTKAPDTVLGHSVPCGGPWPLAEGKGLFTLPLFSDQLSLALWNKHQLVKDFSWAEGSNLVTCITKANHTLCYLRWPHAYIPVKAFWRLGALVEGRNGQQWPGERPMHFRVCCAFSQALLDWYDNRNNKKQYNNNNRYYLSSFILGQALVKIFYTHCVTHPHRNPTKEVLVSSF